jgi:hypothetical protein
MGLLLCAIFIAIVVIWGNVDEDYSKRSLRCALAGVISTFMLYGVGAITINLVTYGDYAKARAGYDSVLAQYGQAIKIYENKAVLDVKVVGDTWTDFRYQGYQGNMAQMITDLRNQVASYNSYLVSRRMWGRNFFVGWYITSPDKDMKTIDIINTLPAQK